MVKELLVMAVVAVLAIMLFIPPPIGTGNLVHKWETWANDFIVHIPGYENYMNISFNTDENEYNINMSSGNLRISPENTLSLPYGSNLVIGDLAGFPKLSLTTAGGNHGLVSNQENLRITTYRNLEIKASNTIFPAVNSITYLLASNAARYNELRACYGTGTSSSRYVSLYNDGTDSYLKSNYGVVNIIPSGNNATVIQSNVTIGTTSKAGCIQIRDSDGANWSKCTILAGVLSCSAGTC